MDCALWLNRKKIRTAAEIADNLDVASLRGYLLAGTLVPWLEEHKGKRFAKRMAALKHDDPRLNEKIAAVFGGASAAPCIVLDGSTAVFSAFGSASSFAAALSSFDIGSPGSYNYGKLSSFGSFYGILQAAVSGSFNSFELSELSGLLSSFNISAASAGSFSYGWEWLWSFFQSYFAGGSFAASSGGSFSYGWEWLWSLLQSYFAGGSFTASSGGSFSYGWEWLWSFFQSYFAGGSFALSSGGSFSYGWEWLWSLLQSYFAGGSFALSSGGSFSYGWEWLTALFKETGSFRRQFGSFNNPNADNLPNFRFDEYDLVLLKTLIDCPLDRFGYGIHNI